MLPLQDSMNRVPTLAHKSLIYFFQIFKELLIGKANI